MEGVTALSDAQSLFQNMTRTGRMGGEITPEEYYPESDRGNKGRLGRIPEWAAVCSFVARAEV
jgi:hypothetical protein